VVRVSLNSIVVVVVAVSAAAADDDNDDDVITPHPGHILLAVLGWLVLSGPHTLISALHMSHSVFYFQLKNASFLQILLFLFFTLSLVVTELKDYRPARILQVFGDANFGKVRQPTQLASRRERIR